MGRVQAGRGAEERSLLEQLLGTERNQIRKVGVKSGLEETYTRDLVGPLVQTSALEASLLFDYVCSQYALLSPLCEATQTHISFAPGNVPAILISIYSAIMRILQIYNRLQGKFTNQFLLHNKLKVDDGSIRFRKGVPSRARLLGHTYRSLYPHNSSTKISGICIHLSYSALDADEKMSALHCSRPFTSLLHEGGYASVNG
jgi:hypothetical protein